MIESFNIKKGDIITITGAGGKTSLLFSLANKLSSSGKVLVTTTTKILVPEKTQYENMYIYSNNSTIQGTNKNIDVLAFKIENNKIFSFPYEILKKYLDRYDYILIEGDGAKEKKFKWWSDTEPCIPNFSTKVIGVINLDILGKNISQENIHRFELFKKIFPEFIEKNIDENFLQKYIPKAHYFKDFSKDKYIFFNGIDGDNYLDKFSSALKISNALSEKNNFNFVFGSIKKQIFFKYLSVDAIIMASGYSKRMGENKLKLPIKNSTFFENTLKIVNKIAFHKIIVCGRDNWTENITKKYNNTFLLNTKADLGQSESIKLGIEHSKADGFVFFTCDQPNLSLENIYKIYYNFMRFNWITIPRYNHQNYSPVFFPKNTREQLLRLQGDVGGREVIKNSNNIKYVKFSGINNFIDLDTYEEYSNFLKNDMEE